MSYLTTVETLRRDGRSFLLRFEEILLEARETASLSRIADAKDLVDPILGYARSSGDTPEQLIRLRAQLLGAVGGTVRSVKISRNKGR